MSISLCAGLNRRGVVTGICDLEPSSSALYPGDLRQDNLIAGRKMCGSRTAIRRSTSRVPTPEANPASIRDASLHSITGRPTRALSGGGETTPDLRLCHCVTDHRRPPVRSTGLIMIEASPSAYPSGMLSLGKRHLLKEEETSGDSTPSSIKRIAASTCTHGPCMSASSTRLAIFWYTRI
jgi:hypothetical protein